MSLREMPILRKSWRPKANKTYLLRENGFSNGRFAWNMLRRMRQIIRNDVYIKVLINNTEICKDSLMLF